MKLLLEKGADPNARGLDGTPFILYLALSGFVELLVQAHDSGADLNLADKNGNTALIVAAMNRQKEMVEKLLSFGAFINAQNKDAKTALMMAVEINSIDIARVLMDNKANVMLHDSKKNTVASLILDKYYRFRDEEWVNPDWEHFYNECK